MKEWNEYKSAREVKLIGDDEKHTHIIFEDKVEAADYFKELWKTAKER